MNSRSKQRTKPRSQGVTLYSEQRASKIDFPVGTLQTKKTGPSMQLPDSTRNLKNPNLSMDCHLEHWLRSSTHQWTPDQSDRNKERPQRYTDRGTHESSWGPMMNLIISKSQHRHGQQNKQCQTVVKAVKTVLLRAIGIGGRDLSTELGSVPNAAQTRWRDL